MKGIEFSILLLMTLSMTVMQALSCKESATETEPELISNRVTPPGWAKNANIYEVNIRQYTPEGTLEAREAG